MGTESGGGLPVTRASRSPRVHTHTHTRAVSLPQAAERSFTQMCARHNNCTGKTNDGAAQTGRVALKRAGGADLCIIYQPRSESPLILEMLHKLRIIILLFSTESQRDCRKDPAPLLMMGGS